MKEGSGGNENVPVNARASGTFAPLKLLHKMGKCMATWWWHEWER